MILMEELLQKKMKLIQNLKHIMAQMVYCLVKKISHGVAETNLSYLYTNKKLQYAKIENENTFEISYDSYSRISSIKNYDNVFESYSYTTNNKMENIKYGSTNSDGYKFNYSNNNYLVLNN